MNKIGVFLIPNNFLLYEFGTNCNTDEIISTLISIGIFNFDIIETPLDLKTFKLLHYVK